MASPKIACMLLMCLVVLSAPMAQATISCGQVNSALISCIGYLRKGPWNPGCCNGLRSLNAAAHTTADRRAACNCLKNAAHGIQGIDYGLAGNLPKKCGISINYSISPNTNCNAIS